MKDILFIGGCNDGHRQKWYEKDHHKVVYVPVETFTNVRLSDMHKEQYQGAIHCYRLQEFRWGGNSFWCYVWVELDEKTMMEMLLNGYQKGKNDNETD